MTEQEMVKQFHVAYGVPYSVKASLPDEARRKLRRKLLCEEFIEYLEGEQYDDLVEIADGLADMLYIAFGTALEYGIDLHAVFAEVHRSNMSKLGEDGKPIRRDDGKVMKGPNYERPQIAKVLGCQR